MSDTFELSVSLPVDKKGMVGRKCHHAECGRYFKLKHGTGLPTDICHCPYCGSEGESSDFLTDDQMEYLKSIAVKHVVQPIMNDFKHSIEQMNRSTRGSFIELKFSVNTPNFRIHKYFEHEVETDVACDSCGLEFAVFGVFASCPDCERLNAYSVFTNNLEVCRKRLSLLKLLETQSDKGLCEAIIQDALSGSISAFDALGKKLRMEYPSVFPERPRNIFQNLIVLNDCLKKHSGLGIEERIDKSKWTHLLRLFQVRHICEHNAGVVDEDFVIKVPSYSHLLGKKYPLERSEIETLIDTLGTLVSSIEKSLENHKE